ncbi:MAG: class I SAM-dependent methyltransferase [Candidatus Omnitrophica bacterium]|nr:class I SAM-dependent methyltransferase [Candidatus Omnitrophota bacterium]
MANLVTFSQGLLEKGLLPDPVIRFGIRELLRQKIAAEKKDGLEFGQARQIQLINQLKASPIAVNTPEANQQHYEVPTEFFKLVLGPHLKYSSCYFRDGVTDLAEAERDMLAITCERADLRNGQAVLEFGCGWGSLSLFMAQKFPESQFVGVSNSRTQKDYIDGQAKARNIKNLEIITSDMNVFETSRRFDRLVSVEMFEHMRNYEKLMAKAASFLKSDGKLFVHIFTHREFSYLYDDTDDKDWIAKYFFTGGIMPSDHLLLSFQDHFQIKDHWRVSGMHYQKTSECWLKNMDAHRDKIIPILKGTYGEQYQKWWVYWRVFFMACAELWGYNGGNEWIVSHYLFNKRGVV